MNSTLGAMGSDDEGYFSDEYSSDDESASESGNESIAAASPVAESKPLLQEVDDADLAAEERAPVAASSAAPVFNQNQQLLMAMMAQSSIGQSAAFAADPTRKVKFFTLGFEGSLKDLASGAKQPVLTCANPNLAKIFGGEEFALPRMSIVAFENNMDVSVGLFADHLRGEKCEDHVADTGLFMVELPRKTSEKLTSQLQVYNCPESNFKRKMSEKFPGENEHTVGKKIVSLGAIDPGFKMVMAGDVVMVGIKRVLLHAKRKLASEGEIYTGPAPVKIEGLDAYKVPDALAVRAINLLRKSFSATDDRVNAQLFHLKFARTRVSSNALDTADSVAASSVWEDPRELRHSLKSGHSLENAKVKSGSLYVKVAVEMANPRK